MDFFWRSFIITLLLILYWMLWQEKNSYKELYLYEKSTKEVLMQYNRDLEKSNVNILDNCADSIIAKIK